MFYCMLYIIFPYANFHRYLEKFSAVYVLFVVEILCPVIQKYSYLVSCMAIPLLCIQCSPLSIYYQVCILLDFYKCIHHYYHCTKNEEILNVKLHFLCSVKVGWMTCLLWEAMTEPIFL